MKIGLVIPAAGSSSRFGGNVNKVLDVQIAEQPMLVHTLVQFCGIPVIKEVVVVGANKDLGYLNEILSTYTLDFSYRVVAGGDTRAESVFLGVQKLDRETDYVLVHDAARPYVNRHLIFSLLKCVGDPAVVPGLPVVDTIKRVVSGQVVETLPRDQLMAVQTPQLFSYSALQEAYQLVGKDLGPEFTDEALLMERAGFPVRVIRGDVLNLKVTYPQDVN
jgi:2-C-methyl-D-erythritol 4-phosphate cytidylyltransferase